MSLEGPKNRMHDAHRKLMLEWRRACESWDDEARREFGKRYIDPLENAVRGSSTAMMELDEVIQRIRNQVGRDRPPE